MYETLSIDETKRCHRRAALMMQQRLLDQGWAHVSFQPDWLSRYPGALLISCFGQHSDTHFFTTSIYRANDEKVLWAVREGSTTSSYYLDFQVLQSAHFLLEAAEATRP